MAVKVKCPCGHIFEARAASFTGMVRCPACGKTASLKSARRRRSASAGESPSSAGGQGAAESSGSDPPSGSGGRRSSGSGGVGSSEITSRGSGNAGTQPMLPLSVPPAAVSPRSSRPSSPPPLQSPPLSPPPLLVPEESAEPSRPVSGLPPQPVASSLSAGPSSPPERHRLAIGLLSGAVGVLGIVAIVSLVVALVRNPPSSPAQKDSADSANGSLTTEQIVARSEMSVGVLRGHHSVGTAFVAQPGLLVTNAHVIRSEFLDEVQIRFPAADENQRGPFTPSLLYEDLKRDLAILSLPKPHVPLSLAGRYRFRRGQDVTVIGNPSVGGKIILQNAVSKGVMSTQTAIDGKTFYQLSIAINPGNSGGPVFDSRGRVIGVVTLKAAKEEGLAFCIPLEDVQAALQRARAQTDEERRRGESHHRAVVLADRGRTVGTISLYTLITYREEMQSARKEGLSPTVGIIIARRKVDEKFGGLASALRQRVRAELHRLQNDPRISLSVKKNLTALWANCDQMQLYVDHPERYGEEQLTAATPRLAKRHQSLVKAVTRALGLPEN